MSVISLPQIDLIDRAEPIFLPWPTPGNPGGFVRFEKPIEWRSFIESLGIDTRIPGIAGAKFARAQTLYLLGWVDVGLIKAGELAALIALELAVKIGRASCGERVCHNVSIWRVGVPL